MADFGLVGKNIDYSFSRSFFNDKFKKEHLDLVYANFDMDSIWNFQ
jgi:shikimate dehydrogenase